MANAFMRTMGRIAGEHDPLVDNAGRGNGSSLRLKEELSNTLPARCGRPLERQALRLWLGRLLLVEFALHGLPGRRVEILLQFGQLLHVLRRTVLWSICPSSACLASELTLSEYENKKYLN